MSEKRRLPVFSGWFTEDEARPNLLGLQCLDCGTHYFPKAVTGCRNPECPGAQAGKARLEQVEMSRTGTLWSYTNACYPPPAPFVFQEPFRPFGIAAVQLEKEQMIVLGAVADGVSQETLRIGMAMEMVLGPLSEDDETVTLTWKWKPAA